MTSTPLRGSRVAAGATAVALALSLAACGGGSEPAPDPGADASAPPAAAPATQPADSADFCEAVVDIESSFGSGPEIDFDTATPEQIQAALQAFGATVEPLLARVEETAPDEVSEDVTTLTGLIRQALETGDESTFESPEFATADDNLDTYMLAECGYEQIEVTAVDFEYQGLPDTITPGVVAVTLTNEGEEQHEVGIARINDGVTQPLEELLALPEDQAMQSVEFKGAAFAPPGESDTSFLRLDQPGRYGALCFIPEGSTADAEGTGPPHFTLGMVGEFTAE